jgi:hypothetical protein
MYLVLLFFLFIRGNRGKKYVGDRGKNKNIYSKKGKDPLPFAK